MKTLLQTCLMISANPEEKRKWADGEADAGRAAKTPPAITGRSMCDGCNVMAC
jgi:hypothetical protein